MYAKKYLFFKIYLNIKLNYFVVKKYDWNISFIIIDSIYKNEISEQYFFSLPYHIIHDSLWAFNAALDIFYINGYSNFSNLC